MSFWAIQLRKLFEEEKITEFLEFILVYADSVETTDEKDKRSQKARELYHYLNNNTLLRTLPNGLPGLHMHTDLPDFPDCFL